jgi:hypothetical protein
MGLRVRRVATVVVFLLRGLLLVAVPARAQVPHGDTGSL